MALYTPSGPCRKRRNSLVFWTSLYMVHRSQYSLQTLHRVHTNHYLWSSRADCSQCRQVGILLMHLLQFSLLQLLKQHPQKVTELQQNVQWAQAIPLASNYYNYIYLTAFYRTTCVSRHQKGKPIWILREQEMMGWQLYQLNHMQIIYTSLQTDSHASFYRPDALPAAQSTASKH